jgi:hypothetical protein
VDPDDRASLRERLANARTPEEATRTLGKQRLVVYASVFIGGALVCLAAMAVVASKVARHEVSAWVLVALPAALCLFLFCGLLGYGGAYYLVTGRRWPKAEKINEFFARLETNI